MSVTINIDSTTNQRELAAIACLIAVLRSDQPIPAPPLVSFDYEGDGIAPPGEVGEPLIAPPPPVIPPPPTEQPASESLLAAEADRVGGQPPVGSSAPGELDVNGLPWDERIHAGTKVKNADKSWRTKRGADPALVASVTAELRAAIGTPGPSAAASVPPPPTEPAADPAADAATALGAGGADSASEAPPPPGATIPPPPASDAPPAAPAPGEITYPQILTRANDAGLDYDTLNALAVEQGLEKFASLAKRKDLLPIFADAMEAKIAELAAPAA